MGSQKPWAQPASQLDTHTHTQPSDSASLDSNRVWQIPAKHVGQCKVLLFIVLKSPVRSSPGPGPFLRWTENRTSPRNSQDQKSMDWGHQKLPKTRPNQFAVILD